MDKCNDINKLYANFELCMMQILSMGESYTNGYLKWKIDIVLTQSKPRIQLVALGLDYMIVQ